MVLKKKPAYLWVILCITILLMVIPASKTAQAQEGDGYWELIGIYTNDWETELAAYNVAEECINLEVSVSEGSASATRTYICEANPMKPSWSQPDITESQTVTWSNPSETIIYPGEPFAMDLSSTITRMDDPELEYLFDITAFYGTIDDLNGIFGRYPHHNYMKDENGIHVAVTSELDETSITTVSGTIDAGSFEGEQMVITVSVYGYISILTKYVYEWRSQPIGSVIGQEPETEPESSMQTPNPASEGGLGRVIVIVGIAIAGTMSAIAAELANKAAQAAASGKEEQPKEETVYVLNPSHKLFNLKVNQPVTLTVNGYRVTQGGHQIEKDALISLSLPPDLAEYFSLQTTGSNGQVSCTITLLKIPSASSVTLEVNGVFPKGKANTQVQLAFKMEFTISPVNSPNITYYEKDKQWRAPELAACFRDAVQNTPIKVGFYYGFMDPPLTFEPDILEVKEGYSSDDGLTYNFKLNVRDGIDLETYFGEDLTEDNGRVTVNVVIKDEQGKEYTAKTELEVHPQLKMIAYAYDPEKGTGKRGRPKTPEGIELEDMQFIADGNDILPLVFFFVRTDKELMEGEEYLNAIDLVDVESVEFVTGMFPAPEKNEADCSKGLFAYQVRTDRAILYSERPQGKHTLEVGARIKASVSKNIGLTSKPLLIEVSPQFLKFDFWVVPGQYKDTSEAFAFVQLYPLKVGVPNMTLSLEVENPSNENRGFLELINGDREQTTRDKDYYLSAEYVPLMQGCACWALKYSNMSWDNLSSCIFKVTCYGPESDTGPIWQASRTIDVGQNISNLLNDLVDQSGQLDLNNPYWIDSLCPVHMRGVIWNIVCKADSSKPYVCKWLREKIMGWLTARSFYGDGDDPKQVEAMMNMNGIEYQYCSFTPFHAWANLFLSGTHHVNDAKALDPWWEQRWTNPSLKDHKNLITVYSELNWKISQRGLGLRAIAEIQTGVLFFAGIVSVISMIVPFLVPITIPSAVSLIMTTYLAGVPAHVIVSYGGTVDYDNYLPDGRKRLFQPNWFTKFIQHLSKSND
jgi:hypothetical protein